MGPQCLAERHYARSVQASQGCVLSVLLHQGKPAREILREHHRQLLRFRMPDRISVGSWPNKTLNSSFSKTSGWTPIGVCFALSTLTKKQIYL